MNVQAGTPPLHLEVFLICRDASNPPENVENWIEQGKLYRLKLIVKANNTEGLSLILADKDHQLIKPSKDFFGIRDDRMERAFELCRN